MDEGEFASPLGPAAGQGRPKDCSTSSSDPMMEGPMCRFRREARARERRRLVVVDSLKRLTPTGRLEKRTHAVQQFTSAAKHWAAVGRAGMWPNGKVNHFMKSS